MYKEKFEAFIVKAAKEPCVDRYEKIDNYSGFHEGLYRIGFNIRDEGEGDLWDKYFMLVYMIPGIGYAVWLTRISFTRTATHTAELFPLLIIC
jgi:hypothetical protein